ncbi:hypothetical protein K466DRAFT_570910 [Polyporus arcularius HHB13444]|uniref:Uncharacterized protein n=1 Tax=Polyporus arcularius HHB13444 TaxID=1314778 RepID=A0A5C3NPQ6_9APHY|nr:hypothetical protein K466DRAFT_570910 [Polyporus arcularius HHB13444]
MPSEAALDAWTRRIINSVPVEIYHVNRPAINAPDVESAARVLLFLIEWQFTHNVQSATRAAQDAFRQALTDSCGPANTCSLTTHYMLLRNARTLGIRVGAGLGAGVQRSVLRAAVDIVVHDQACWQEMGRYYIPTIHLDGVTTVSARIAKMKTAGFLSMLHLLAGLGGPHPISPFLLLLAIVGRERACLVDAPLWRVLDVELYERFRPWWEYDGMSAVPVSDPRIFGLLTAASYDRLEDVEWLLSKLVFSSPLNRKKIDEAAATSNEVSQDYIDITFESAFEDRVRFYLVQPGHPDHDEVKAMVGAERFQREREDPVLRARLFLQTIHGCDLVPMDPDIQFTFVFRHTGSRVPVPANEDGPQPAPLFFRTCFNRCEVDIDRGVRNILDEAHPYRHFQAWFHGGLLEPNSFNMV